MSRRRSISTDLSTDPRLARVTDEHGPLPLLLYTWAIPHACDYGRLPADPLQFRLLVCPALPVTTADVEEAIEILIEAGLWRRASVDGREHLQFPEDAWFREQSYIPASKRPQATHTEAFVDERPETPRNAADHRETPQSFEQRRETPQNPSSPSLSPTLSLSLSQSERKRREAASPPAPEVFASHSSLASLSVGSEESAPASGEESLPLCFAGSSLKGGSGKVAPTSVHPLPATVEEWPGVRHWEQPPEQKAGAGIASPDTGEARTHAGEHPPPKLGGLGGPLTPKLGGIGMLPATVTEWPEGSPPNLASDTFQMPRLMLSEGCQLLSIYSDDNFPATIIYSHGKQNRNWKLSTIQSVANILPTPRWIVLFIPDATGRCPQGGWPKAPQTGILMPGSLPLPRSGYTVKQGACEHFLRACVKCPVPPIRTLIAMNISAAATTETDAAHLLRRAGFGPTPDEVQQAVHNGLSATTDALLNPERTPDPTDYDLLMTRLSSLVPDRTDKQGNEYLPIQVVKMWWTYRMITSPHSLQEKMTLFWHGHFTSKGNGRDGDLMLRQNQLFRTHALGNFRTLTQAVSRDPEMLRYLNGNENRKAHPNENYGRELMELFTCGIGNYTEDDVKAAARSFSGWNLRGGDFAFNAGQHDNDPKTFMGQTGNWNGDDVVDALVAHPATARRLCTQLWTYFAYSDPEPTVVNSLVKTYYESGYDIRAILGRILRSQAFYSDKARFAVIKSPAQYAVGSVRALGLAQIIAPPPQSISAATDGPSAGMAPAGKGARLGGMREAGLGALALLPIAMRGMGQDILEPPTVKGWDGGTAWINSATLLARISFANALSQSRQAFGGQFALATNFVQQQNFSTAQWVDYLAHTLGPLPLSPQTRQALIDYVDSTDDDAPAAAPAVQNAALKGQGGQRGLGRAFGPPRRLFGREARLRGVLPLLMATPEYQVC